MIFLHIISVVLFVILPITITITLLFYTINDIRDIDNSSNMSICKIICFLILTYIILLLIIYNYIEASKRSGLSEYIWILAGCNKPNFRPHLHWMFGKRGMPSKDCFTDSKFVIPITLINNQNYYSIAKFREILQSRYVNCTVVKDKPFIDCDGTTVNTIKINDANNFTVFESELKYYKDMFSGEEYYGIKKMNKAYFSVDYKDENVSKLLKEFKIDEVNSYKFYQVNDGVNDDGYHDYTLGAFVRDIQTINSPIFEHVPNHDILYVIDTHNEYALEYLVSKYFDRKNEKLYVKLVKLGMKPYTKKNQVVTNIDQTSVFKIDKNDKMLDIILDVDLETAQL